MNTDSTPVPDPSASPAPLAEAPVLHDIDERHEVPEGRVVRGRHLSFRASVFGEVISEGGNIQLDDALGWGKAVSHGGQILVRKKAFNATIQAPGGVVKINSAESCLIIGREVTVREATQCQIFAHSLRVGSASGCLIAGRNLHIQQARPYRHEPNLLTVVVPELPDLEPQLLPLQQEIMPLQSQVEALSARIEAIKADPVLAHYLSIRVKVRAGMVKLSDEQALGYQQLDERFSETAKALEAAVAERRPLSKALSELLAQAQAMRDMHAQRLAECRCLINRVEGETLVRQQRVEHDDPDLSLIPLPMIPKILFRNDASVQLVCAPQSGQVDWSPLAAAAA